MGAKLDRIGEIRRNKESLGSYEMKIIEYNGNNDIVVEFQDKYKVKVHTQYHCFKDGSVKNPYHPNIFGVGYFGQGKYKSETHLKIYEIWKGILKRCYDEKIHKKQPTYIKCEVCEEWYDFQNFARWYEENYYEIEGEMIELDKDILVKGNKIYSPETCIFVPQRINVLFTKRQNRRGEYPIGVNYYKRLNKLTVGCSMGCKNKTEYLGLFPLDRPFQAFTCYKNFKESYIKQVADEYKDLIPVKLYDAMYKYEVEIND